MIAAKAARRTFSEGGLLALRTSYGWQAMESRADFLDGGAN